MIALGKLDQFDPGSNFTAWMARIVRFVALNHGRKRAAQTLVDPGALDASHDTHSARRSSATDDQCHALNGRGDIHPEQTAFDDQLLAALNTLEPNARACLLLRIVLNMPYREIARALDMAEGTAMSHVHRSRLALRDVLVRRVQSTPSVPNHGDAHADG